MSNITIALAGNPNCGKTTLFNALTGANQYVGNWPGVTVEKKEGRLKGHKNIIIEDLPGIYSLSPYTLEEVVSRNYLVTDHPSLILNLVDGSNLERNLYLTTQLCELGVPVIIALNMMDIVRKRGDRIDTEKLSGNLGCQVLEISALKGTGIRELIDAVVTTTASDDARTPQAVHFPDHLEKAIGEIGEIITGKCLDQQKKWFAVKVFERDQKVADQLALNPEEQSRINGIIETMEREMDDDSESIITNERYNSISRIINDAVVKASPGSLTGSDRIDRIITNRWLGLPIFAVVMWAVYYISIQTIGAWGTDWANDTFFGEWVPEWVGSLLENAGCAPWLESLIQDGVIAGVGAVLGFLPQMAVLFLCLGILEDCGYMARVAFIMDRIFRKFGLSGKSFIPMLVSMGCGVPGVMATRTIENEKDRRMTIMTTTFIPCGAKTPIIALIAGAFFPENSWVAPGAYFIGVGAIILSGLILKKTAMFAGDPTPFVMELPIYHIPAWKNVIIHAWDRCKAFVQKAGTVIFVSSALIWFLSSYNWKVDSVEQNDSMLASIGNVAAPVFQPLGWGEWKPTMATITGLIAKENVVGTFGVLYADGSSGEDEAEKTEDSPETQEMAPAGRELQASLEEGSGESAAEAEEEEDEDEEIRETGDRLVQAGAFTFLSAFSFMIFNLLCAPCFAAMGAIRREMNSAKWTFFAIGYMCALAYCLAFLIYQLGAWLYAEASFGIGQGIALLLLLGLVYLVAKKPYTASK